MPRFGATRFIAALFGFAGLVAMIGITPARADHPVSFPGDSSIVGIGDPTILFGLADEDDPEIGPGGDFTHTFTFGVDLGGIPGPQPGFVSATPNFLPPEALNEPGTDFIAGFDDFEGTLTDPFGTVTDLDREDMSITFPRSNTISAEFAAVDTGGEFTYTLTIFGSLLDRVEIGNYSGNIGVTPLPGAALLFLSALGGLVAFRRYRQAAAAA